MNKTILIGRLGKDAEVKSLNNEKVARFSLAVDDGKDKNGDKHTLWFYVTLFGKSVSGVGQYLTKGKQVAVEGRVGVFKMKDGDASLQLAAYQIELLGGSNDSKPKEKPEPEDDGWPTQQDEPF